MGGKRRTVVGEGVGADCSRSGGFENNLALIHMLDLFVKAASKHGHVCIRVELIGLERSGPLRGQVFLPVIGCARNFGVCISGQVSYFFCTEHGFVARVA